MMFDKDAFLRDLNAVLAKLDAGEYDTLPVPEPNTEPEKTPNPEPDPEDNPYRAGSDVPVVSSSGNPFTDNPGVPPAKEVAVSEVSEVTDIASMDPVAQGRAIVALALTQQGKSYGWGATGPDRWDCSGLTQWAVREVTGRDPGRTTFDQIASPHGVEVPFSEARAGDLIFSNFSARGPEHVSINMDGANDVVEAGDPVGVYGWGDRGRVVVKRFV